MTICADFGHTHKRFGENSGKQCAAMALTATVYRYIKNINSWNSTDLNNICLYGYINASIKHDHLLLDELTRMISINEKTFNLNYNTSSISGDIFLSNNSEPYMTLKKMLLQKYFLEHAQPMSVVC